jgi:eukaryotic-like serine/threonine-protein kinase
MGEVYRARDARLGRDVAIKVLARSAADDPDRVRRLHQEAQATAALAHANILAVFDIGIESGSTYVVSELLQGSTLRGRLDHGPLPLREAVRYAMQIADGLAAAHDKGIVHRDLKPENLFITESGTLKILDFGLAKLSPIETTATAGSMLPTTPPPGTVPGTVMGTVGYMAPEQVRGGPVDHRGDLFALGAVLYEMVSGRRAFQGDSAVETMHAILNSEPPEFKTGTDLPPTLERIIRRCLAKRPVDRFQSAGDLSFALEAALSPSTTRNAPAVPDVGPFRTPRRLATLPVVAMVVLALAAGVAIGRYFTGRSFSGGSSTPLVPNMEQLTYERGTLRSARFVDDQTIVYSAAWQGQPFRVFLTRPASGASTPLDGPPTHLFAVSRSGELAVSLGHRFDGWLGAGTLSRVPLSGGGARPVMENVRDADWTADGSGLIVVRRVNGRDRLEWPAGKVVYETNGFISSPRLSRDGTRVAFADHPIYADNNGHVAVIDSTGTVTRLAPNLVAIRGVAWSPDGSEVWFAAATNGGTTPPTLRAVDLSGRARSLLPGAIDIGLMDVSAAGRLLIAREVQTRHIEALLPETTMPRDLSLFDGSVSRVITDGGRAVLVTEQTGRVVTYLRQTDNPAPVRLGEGDGWDISRDGKWAMVIIDGPPARVRLFPTGVGEPRELPNSEKLSITSARFSPDGRRIVLLAARPNEAFGGFVQDVASGSIKSFAPPGIGFIRSRMIAITADGRSAAFTNPAGQVRLYPIDGGEPTMIPGLGDDEFPLLFAADGRSVYVTSGYVAPWQITRLDLQTGQRTPWRQIGALQPAGVRLSAVGMSPDAQAVVHSYSQLLSDLYLVDGVK